VNKTRTLEFGSSVLKVFGEFRKCISPQKMVGSKKPMVPSESTPQEFPMNGHVSTK
jgi:hypothetical protein